MTTPTTSAPASSLPTTSCAVCLCASSWVAATLENNTVELMRRDTLEKEEVSFDGIADRVKRLLEEIQENIYRKAVAFRDAHIYECDNYDEFKERIKDGGFFLCHWDGTPETEAKIDCAKKLFAKLSDGLVTYDHVDSYQELMNKVLQ